MLLDDPLLAWTTQKPAAQVNATGGRDERMSFFLLTSNWIVLIVRPRECPQISTAARHVGIWMFTAVRA